MYYVYQLVNRFNSWVWERTGQSFPGNEIPVSRGKGLRSGDGAILQAQIRFPELRYGRQWKVVRG